MEARIILSQADFSANNIGRYIELDDLTKKVLAKQTQYTEDSAEGLALNSYILSLKNGGFIGGNSPKLTFLSVPALASTHDELLYNFAAVDGSGYPVNAMNSAELGKSECLYQTFKDSDNKVIGILVKRLGDSSLDNVTDRATINLGLYEGLSVGTDIPSTSLVVYGLKNNMTTVNDVTILANRSANYRIMMSNKNFGLYLNSSQNNDRLLKPVEGQIKGFFGVTYEDADGTKSLSYLSDTANLGTEDRGSSTDFDIQTNSGVFTFGNERIYDNQCFATSLIAAGYLTSEEMATFKSITNTLMTALHVNAYIENL